LRKSRIVLCLAVATGCLLVALAIGIVRWIQFLPLLAFQNEKPLYALPDPIPRTPNPPNTQETTEFQAFGYRFTLPWHPVAGRIKNERVAGLMFETGPVFLLHNPHATIGWRNEFERPESRFVLEKLESAYGEDCCANVFEIVTLILNATPARLSFLRSFGRNSADALLLTYKRMYLDKVRTLTFIAHENLRAYQIGETTDAEPVRLLIFAEKTVELRVDIGRMKQGVTQAEIDAVLTGFDLGTTDRNSN
jgi:hypothetical protein